MPGFTFYDILRDHSLNQLLVRDTERLKEYQILLHARIEEKQALMNRPNMLSNERSELAEDVRWYQSISQDIAAILTVEFHLKAH